MKRASLLFFIFFGLYPLTGFALETRGYTILQASSAGLRTSVQKNVFAHFELANINRLNLLHESSGMTYELGLELNQIYETNDLTQSSPYSNLKTPYRIFRENPVLNLTTLEQDNYLLLGQVDRLTLEYQGLSSSFIFGRQQISFGASKFVSPLDVFAPNNPSSINTEERSGVDAARFKTSIGEMGEFGLGVVMGQNLSEKKSAAFLNLKYSFYNIEFEALAARYLQVNMLGLQVLKSIYGTNTWIELAYNEGQYTRFTVGTEYQWSPRFYTAAEYHYNGAGKSEVSGYPLALAEFSFTSVSVFLLSKNYLNVLLGYQLSPLTFLSGRLTSNLLDHSYLFSLGATKSLSNNSQNDFGITLGMGPKGSSLSLVLSEFGHYGAQAYYKYKYFF